MPRASWTWESRATLVSAGTRPDEAGRGLVGDVAVARSGFKVERSKTAAGLRTIDLLPVRYDMLAEDNASHAGDLDDLLFLTARGRPARGGQHQQSRAQPVLERAEELPADPRPAPAPKRSDTARAQAHIRLESLSAATRGA